MEKTKEAKNDLQKYFQFGQITQLVGANSANKQRLLSFLLQKKILTDKIKVLYLDTELSLPCTFITNSIEKLCPKELQVYKDQLLNSFLICRLTLDQDIANFIEKELPRILGEVREVRVVVIDNLTHFLSNQKKKSGKSFIRDLFYITKKYKISLVYVNDMVYKLHGGTFSYEINYGELFGDFVNHCIYLKDSTRFSGVTECCVIKSNYYPLEAFEFRFDMDKLSLKVVKQHK